MSDEQRQLKDEQIMLQQRLLHIESLVVAFLEHQNNSTREQRPGQYGTGRLAPDNAPAEAPFSTLMARPSAGNAAFQTTNARSSNTALTNAPTTTQRNLPDARGSEGCKEKQTKDLISAGKFLMPGPTVPAQRYWGAEEHALYLLGAHRGYPLERLAQLVGSRNVKQIRSHSQKYSKRLAGLLSDADAAVASIGQAPLERTFALYGGLDFAAIYSSLKGTPGSVARCFLQAGASVIDGRVDYAMFCCGVNALKRVPELSAILERCLAAETALYEGHTGQTAVANVDDYETWGRRGVELEELAASVGHTPLLLAAETTLLGLLSCVGEDAAACAHLAARLYCVYTKMLCSHDPQYFQVCNTRRAVSDVDVAAENLVAVLFCFHCFAVCKISF